MYFDYFDMYVCFINITKLMCANPMVAFFFYIFTCINIYFLLNYRITYFIKNDVTFFITI